MKKIFPITDKIERREELIEDVRDHYLQKRSTIFSRISMMVSLTLVFIAVYLLLEVVLDIDEKKKDIFNIFYFILFFATQGIIISFFLSEIAVRNQRIKNGKKKIDHIDIMFQNKKRYKDIRNIIRSIKHDSELEDDYQENYPKILKELYKLREPLKDQEVKQELNYILYLIFHGDNNGFHSGDIVEKIEDLDFIKEILDYIVVALREGDHSVGIESKTEEEVERFFLAIKKILEKRYTKERKEIEKREKKQKETEGNIKKMAEDLDNSF